MKGDTGASLRSIGRSVAAEVERYFETKVKPETILKRASRMSQKQGVTNVTPEEKLVNSDSKPAATLVESPTITLNEAVELVRAELLLGVTSVQASKIIGQKYGFKPNSLRTAHSTSVRKASQNWKWAVAERDLDRLINYMEKSCDSPATNVDSKVLSRFCNHVDTLQIYCDDLQQGE